RDRRLDALPGAENEGVVVEERRRPRLLAHLFAEEVHGRAFVALGGHALGLGLDRPGQLGAVEAAADEEHAALRPLLDPPSSEEDAVDVALGVEARLLFELRESRGAALALAVLAEALVE